MRREEFTRVIDAEDLIPSEMEPEALYIVPDGYHGLTCVGFLCPCGCGGFHLIPTYKPGEAKPLACAWEITREAEKITLSPSLLNDCGAHFFIRENKVTWC